MADRYGVPRICLINKMDRTGADFENSVESIRERLQAKPLVLHLPLGCEADFRGIISLSTRKYGFSPRRRTCNHTDTGRKRTGWLRLAGI